MANLEIKKDKSKTAILLNGTDISKLLSGVDLKIEAGCYPNLTLYAPLVPSAAIFLNNVEVKSDPKLLQMAAEVIRTEFVQKGDWHNALVDSIAQYLRTFPANKGLYSVAEELADRIIGIESDSDSIDNLNLSVRTYVCLKRAGINTVSQLRNMYSGDLREITSLDYQDIDEIAEKLEKV